MTHISPFPTRSAISHPFCPLLSLSSLPFPLEVDPSNSAGGLGKRCKFPQQVPAEPGRQTIFSAFWAANASGESNFKGIFTKNMFVFSLFTSNNATALREAQIGQHIMPFNTMLRFVTVCTISYLLLGRVDLRAQRPIVIKLSRGRPVGLCVGLSSALWKNGGSVLDAVWHRRSDGSIGMRQVVAFEDRSTGRGTFGGEFGAPYCNQWGLYGVRVDFCSDAALFPNYFGQTCYLVVIGHCSDCCESVSRVLSRGPCWGGK